MTERVLSERELGRALLERQSLLDRRRVSLPAAVERMGGVQAQYAPSIYIGLWSRVDGVERRQVTRALERKALVQATLLRNTIHVVSPADYWQFAEATRDSRRALWLQGRAKRGPKRAQVEAAARRMRPRLEEGPADRKELMPLAGGDAALFNGATLWLDVVRVPPAGTWEHRRADIYALAERWLDRGRPEHPRRHLVERYLGAFGPAAVADIASWSGIPPAELKPVLEKMELRRFRGEEDGSCSTCRGVRFPIRRRGRRCASSPPGTPPCSCTLAAAASCPSAFARWCSARRRHSRCHVHRGRSGGRHLARGEGPGAGQAVRAAAEGGPAARWTRRRSRLAEFDRSGGRWRS